MGGLILDSLEIQGFRAFEHLLLQRLGRINLVVGKNNVGKTCLLEALRLYAGRGSPDTIQEILASRDEIRRSYYQEQPRDEDQVRAFKHLFHGWELLQEHTRSTQFSAGPANDPESQLSVTVEWFEEQSDPETSRSVWRPAVQLTLFDTAEDYQPGIVVRLGKESIVAILLNRFFSRRTRLSTLPLAVKDIPCIFVSADGLEGNIRAFLWDRITLTVGEEDVLAGLRIIAPEVQRVNLLSSDTLREPRVPVAKVEGLSEPIPLRSLGEGMHRLFGIILALVNARDGLLLIDEIDSGLHYSVHKNLWSLVFQIAARLNVQVFATTHSWDCIEGFQRSVDKEGFEGGMLIRLERRQDHIVPIVFDRERLGIATRQDIEVR